MKATLERELGTGDYLLSSAQARAAALERAGATSSGVLVPLAVWRRPDGVVAFTVSVAPGASLAEVRAQRALTLGECIGAGVGIAQALAAMHVERLAHGDVSAANVVVAGRTVTLVDTLGALVDAGEASPAGDVAALGMLLRGLADEAAAPVVAAWTAPLLVEDPAARPSAAHAAAALARCAPAVPIRAVAAPVAAAMRAATLPRTAPRRDDRWWRVERAAVRRSPLALVSVGAVFAGMALVPAVAAYPPLADRPAAIPMPTTLPIPDSVLASPVEAAVELTERRVAALARGDAAALATLTRPGSQAATDNPASIDPFEGLRLKDANAVHKASATGQATVEVTSALSGYSVGQERFEPATVSATLLLTLTPRGWLVERILPQP